MVGQSPLLSPILSILSYFLQKVIRKKKSYLQDRQQRQPIPGLLDGLHSTITMACSLPFQLLSRACLYPKFLGIHSSGNAELEGVFQGCIVLVVLPYTSLFGRLIVSLFSSQMFQMTALHLTSLAALFKSHW